MPKEDVTRFLNSATISYKGDSGNFAGGEQPGPGSLGGPPTPGGGFGGPPTPGGGFGGPPPGGIGIPQPPAGGLGGFQRPPGGIGIPQPPAGGPGGAAGAPVGEGAVPGGFQPPPGAGGGPGGLKPGGLGQPPGGGLGGPGGIGGGGQRPGGGGLGQPGGGLGGFGGGLDNNPPPFGASTDGNRKANVEPFFSGAFDPEKKEFFTFASKYSPSNVISTRLNRFDVAKDFAPAGSYKVPSFATRAVIDSKGGLLYAATIARPTVSALSVQRFDQAVGVGDVQIFDLNQLRDGGKVKDGGDLRPIATIGFGREIRGLELSADCKSLVVLSSTTGRSAKSFLTVYDTETRKALNPPKELSAPAWDSCKSPDGKHIIVIDKVETGNASMARMYDMSSLVMVKTVGLQGGGLDIAATSSGQYAAAIVANGASKVVLASDKETRDLEVGIGWKAAAKPGYLEYSSDGKILFVSGHPYASGSYPSQGQQGQSAGLDVYEVTDAEAPNGVKKKASIRTAGGQMVGGHFIMSPGGEYIVFHTGAVVETANIGGNNGEGTVGGLGGGAPGPGPGAGGVQPAPGGGVQPRPGGGGLSPEEQMKRRQGGGVQPGPGGGQQGPGGPPPGLEEQMKRRGGGGVQPGPGGGGGVQPPPKGGSDLEEQMKRRGGQVQPGPRPPGG